MNDRSLASQQAAAEAGGLKTPWITLLLLGLVLAIPLAADAAAAAATVVMLSGKATALGADGSVRQLTKSDAVYSGDLINSGIGSYVNLKFADGAFFLLRPETRFQIEQYQYAAAPAVITAQPAAPLVTGNQQTAAGSATSRAFFRLVKGGFRSVSGLIGKLNHEDYQVITPIATIGIRGTSYSARLCEGSCEDREQIVAELGKLGRSVSTQEALLVTTVDEGGIELASGGATATQEACPGSGKDSSCGALLTSASGVVSLIPVRPAVETKERNLDPKACE